MRARWHVEKVICGIVESSKPTCFLAWTMSLFLMVSAASFASRMASEGSIAGHTTLERG